MKIYTDSSRIKACANKYIFLDNDFLRDLFGDEEMLQEFLELLPEPNLLVDPLTEFEFLRDIHVPEQRKVKEAFIKQPLFLPIPNHQSIFLKIQDNALILSRIYSQQNKGKGASFVDLMLAGRIMLNHHSTLLITGNKKDYPSIIFDTLAVINFERPGDGVMRSFCVVEFNMIKFEKYFKIE